MKRFLILLILLTFLVGFSDRLFADSGACSGHGGVSCSAGPDYDGSVICNDGWRDSTVLYTSMQMCGGMNIRHDYSECDKYRTNSNLPKSLAKSRYEACVRDINSGDYEKEWDRIMQESEAEIQASQQRYNEELRRMEKEDRQLEVERARKVEEWNRIIEEANRSKEPATPDCGTNSTLGNDNLCYCNAGYEVNSSETACIPIVCPQGYASNGRHSCVPTTEQCKKEYGSNAKANSQGGCSYCPSGQFINKDWLCESYSQEKTTKNTEIVDQPQSKIQNSVNVNTNYLERSAQKENSRPSIVKRIIGWLGGLFNSSEEEDATLTESEGYTFYTKANTNVRECKSINCDRMITLLKGTPIEYEVSTGYSDISKLPEWVGYTWTDEEGQEQKGYLSSSLLTAEFIPLKLPY